MIRALHVLLATHEAGHAVSRLALFGQVGDVELREGGGSTECRPEPDPRQFWAERDDGLTILEAEMMSCWAGPLAEQRYAEPHGLTVQASREGHEALDRLLAYANVSTRAKLRRESRLMAFALVDEHWRSITRLAEALLARPLPVIMPARLIEAIVRGRR